MRASAASVPEILRYIVLTIFLIYCSQDELYPLTLGLNVWNSVSNAGVGAKPSYHLIALGSFISVCH
ncbi:MAG: hypothetical protein WB696_03240 [Chthoniobacterales bacterium]